MAPLKILWAANNYWDSPFQVGSNNIAREFAAMGMRIAFLSDPISPLHLLAPGAKDTFWGRWATWRAGGGRDLDGSLFYYSPFSLLVPANRPLLRARRILDHWPRLTVPNVVRTMKRAGFDDVDLLIVDTVPQHFWLDALRFRRSVVRVTDFFGGFQKATSAMLEREREMIRRADAVVYTARNLRPIVEAASPKRAEYVPNGITVDRFATGDRRAPDEYTGIPSPRVVYVGALEEWFDLELVVRCATAYPHASFVIIGPPRIDLSALAPYPNVHIVGARQNREVPRYLWNADVGIIPFQTTHPVIRSVHPIKLYEYIACELPVVTTRWEEVDEIPLDFYKAEDHAGFVAALGVALKAGKARQELAQFSWRRAAERILDVAFAP